MSQNTKGQFPSLQQPMYAVNQSEHRIAVGDTKLDELEAAAFAAIDAHDKVEKAEITEAHKRATASPEYACWRAASKGLSDYEAALDLAEGISHQESPSRFTTLQQIGDLINRRERRIAAGDSKLAVLEAKALAASNAHDKVEAAEMTEAHKRATASPEYATWRAVAKRLCALAAESDAADGRDS